MLCYKLTTQSWKTRAGFSNETLWGPGVKHTAEGCGSELCTDGMIHAYTSPLLAVLLNPIHVNIRNPVLWEAKGYGVVVTDKGLKIGFKTLKTTDIIPLPKVTPAQVVKFAALCANAARRAAYAAAADVDAAAAADVDAAAAAASARYATAVADATARRAAYAAAAVEAATAAAYAADAAAYAAGTTDSINFIKLAEKAMEE